MKVLAIDPGPDRSAWASYDSDTGAVSAAICDNGALVEEFETRGVPDDVVVIEMIASYGMAVGAEVFETCVWIGRFMQALPNTQRMFRREVKLHICSNPRANDSNIRQAIIDRFGGKERAVGKKKTPGPLYGIKGDEWQALAVALTFADTKTITKPDRYQRQKAHVKALYGVEITEV